MAENSSTHPRVLRFKQVLERVGLSRSTIYDRMNPASPRYDSSFPKPMKMENCIPLDHPFALQLTSHLHST